MRLTAAIVSLLLAGNVLGAAEPGAKVFPLTPSDGSRGGPRGGWTLVKAGADGTAERPFTTASGKLRLKAGKQQIQIDANDDGQFGADESVKSGGRISVNVKVAGKPYAYPMMLYASGQNIYVTSLASLEAQFDGIRLQILDGNCNGIFGDQTKGANGQSDLLVVGDKGQARQLGRYAQVGTSIYEMEVLEAGASLKLTPYGGPTSQLSVTTQQGYTVTALIRNKENGFQVEAKSGAAAVALPGTYVIDSVQLAATGANQQPRQRSQASVMLYGRGGSEIQIKEGGAQLAFGLPLKLDFRAVNTAKGVSVKEINLVGAGGEVYTANNTGAAGKGSLDVALRSGTETVPGAKLSFG